MSGLRAAKRLCCRSKGWEKGGRWDERQARRFKARRPATFRARRPCGGSWPSTRPCAAPGMGAGDIKGDVRPPREAGTGSAGLRASVLTRHHPLVHPREGWGQPPWPGTSPRYSLPITPYHNFQHFGPQLLILGAVPGHPAGTLLHGSPVSTNHSGHPLHPGVPKPAFWTKSSRQGTGTGDFCIKWLARRGASHGAKWHDLSPARHSPALRLPGAHALAQTQSRAAHPNSIPLLHELFQDFSEEPGYPPPRSHGLPQTPSGCTLGSYREGTGGWWDTSHYALGPVWPEWDLN